MLAAVAPLGDAPPPALELRVKGHKALACAPLFQLAATEVAPKPSAGDASASASASAAAPASRQNFPLWHNREAEAEAEADVMGGGVMGGGERTISPEVAPEIAIAQGSSNDEAPEDHDIVVRIGSANPTPNPNPSPSP